MLTIGEVSRRSGVPSSTIRAWETNYGFPSPARLPGGHRRYLMSDCTALVEVAAARARGMTVADAIDEVVRRRNVDGISLFETLRMHEPNLPLLRLRRRTVLALSRAIEDEQLQAGRPAVLVGAFQRPEHFRHQQQRWRQLSAGSRLALVFADFGSPGPAGEEPVQVPLGPNRRLGREWAVIAHGPTMSACVVAREVIAQRVPGGSRRYDTLWSVDPELVSEVVAAALRAAEPHLDPAIKVNALIGGRVRRSSSVRSSRLFGRVIVNLDGGEPL